MFHVNGRELKRNITSTLLDLIYRYSETLSRVRLIPANTAKSTVFRLVKLCLADRNT